VQEVTIIGNTVSFHHQQPIATLSQFMKNYVNLKSITGDEYTDFIQSKSLDIPTSNALYRSHFYFEGDAYYMLSRLIMALGRYLSFYQNSGLKTNFKELSSNLEEIKLKTGVYNARETVEEITNAHHDLIATFMPNDEMNELLTSYENYSDFGKLKKYNGKITDYFKYLNDDADIGALFEQYYSENQRSEKDKWFKIFYDQLKLCRGQEYNMCHDHAIQSQIIEEFNKLENINEIWVKTYATRKIEVEQALETEALEKPETKLIETPKIELKSKPIQTKPTAKIKPQLIDKPLIDKLVSYLKGIDSHKKNGKTDFASGFWFFAESRALNRKANYLLAKEFINHLEKGIPAETLFNYADELRKKLVVNNKLDVDPNYVERGLNSSTLNEIIESIDDSNSCNPCF
nr:hypothetical protein [Tatlockia sp.]